MFILCSLFLRPTRYFTENFRLLPHTANSNDMPTYGRVFCNTTSVWFTRRPMDEKGKSDSRSEKPYRLMWFESLRRAPAKCVWYTAFLGAKAAVDLRKTTREFRRIFADGPDTKPWIRRKSVRTRHEKSLPGNVVVTNIRGDTGFCMRRANYNSSTTSRWSFEINVVGMNTR